MERFVCVVFIVVALSGVSYGQANWGDWSAWGTCSETCGSGTSTRTRACNNPPPTAGQATCAGAESETQVCLIMNYCIPSVTGNTDKNCQAHEFGCAAGIYDCVNMTLKCDGNIDCEDGSDENPYFTDCPEVMCFSGATVIGGQFLTVLMMTGAGLAVLFRV